MSPSPLYFYLLSFSLSGPRTHSPPLLSLPSSHDVAPGLGNNLAAKLEAHEGAGPPRAREPANLFDLRFHRGGGERAKHLDLRIHVLREADQAGREVRRMDATLD